MNRAGGPDREAMSNDGAVERGRVVAIASARLVAEHGILATFLTTFWCGG